MFRPRFTLSGKTVRALMAIEADRQVISALPLSVPMLESLRRSARLLSTHLSTQIEGNRLTAAQVREVVEDARKHPGRERDEAEVRHYFAALAHVEKLGRKATRLTERDIRTIHGLVMTGQARPTRYRNRQNVIREARTNRIIYMPPEARDVAGLMRDLVTWVNANLKSRELPVPVAAALAHYQFATIHPYFDGNGRTARLLTTLILHRHGYGLNGIYALEEYYAANLEGYYAGLSVGKSHNYYFGRAEADVSAFVDYFCVGMADALAKVRHRAEEANRVGSPDATPVLRNLSPQQRQVLGLFLRERVVNSKDIARFFGSSPRHASALCAKWVKEKFLALENPSTKARSYRLAAAYESLIVSRLGEPRGLPLQ